MNKSVSRLCSPIACLVCALATSVSAQTPAVLFQDGFENSLAGAPLAATNPSTGSYVLVGTTSSNLMVLSGPVAGGPDGAREGTNYLRFDMTQGGAPAVHAMFATPFFATNAPFHVSFYKWRPPTNGWPQMIIGSGTTVSALTELVYTTDWPTNLAWRWYNGAYNDSGINFTASHWDLVEMDWDGTSMTGSTNGGPPTPLGIFGSSDKLINRIRFINGGGTGGGTIFYLDDLKVTTTAPILLRSFQPAQGATGVSRLPVVQLQLVDGTQALQTGTIQLFLNNVSVIPVVTQTNSAGFNVTTITYQPSSPLVYGSSNTVRCVYADNTVPAHQYTREWGFTVYTADPIFADNYEASTQTAVPFNYGNAFEGTNCLAVNRIGTGRPDLTGAGDTNQTSVAGDLITLSCAVRVDGGVLALLLGNSTGLSTAASSQIGKINLFADSRISIVDATGAVNQYLTQTLNTNPLVANAWNTLVLQYTNGSSAWSVSVNGAPFETMLAGKANVSGVRWNTAATGTIAWCDALVLSNSTANTVLFKDGFEKGADGLPPVASTPTVGTYSTIAPGTVAGGLFVAPGINGTNFLNAPPNAPQLGTYDNTTTALVATGTGHGGTKFVDLYQGNMKMAFITPIPSGIQLHAEAWIKWQAGQVGWGLDAEGDDQFARLTINDAFGITLFDGTTEVDTGYGHTTGVWEKYELDYVVGATTINFTFNSIYSNTVSVTPRSTIKGLFFFENDALSSRASVDDVLASARLGDIPATNPRLAATPSGNQLILSWTNATGYVLQSNINVSNPNGWVNVTGGGVSPVRVTIGSPAVFYRLAKPL